MKNPEVGLRFIPIWLPVALAAITILCSAGATSATIGSRLAEAERRIDTIERDRVEKLRDYQQFKNDMRGDISEIKTDLGWIRRALLRNGF
jgi:hypothetical protein